MSSRVPKSYREQKPFAPYRKPVVKRTNQKVPFLSKIKNLFNNNEKDVHNLYDSNNALIHRKRPSVSSRRASSIAKVPGGFFDPNASSVSIKDDSISNSNIDVSKQFNDSLNEFDTSNASISSNARLASFFAKKGDAALSEIEMEGVLSLMKKAKHDETNDSITVHDGSIVNDNANKSNMYNEFEEPSILKKGKQRLASTSSFKLPSFNPRYDHSMVSTTSNKRNLSFASTASSTRRVFDYSSMPSPYKTVVFRYKSAANNVPTRHESSTSRIEKPVSSSSGSTKKLSNTASALISLLDGNQTDDTKKVLQNPSSLANPYSNYPSRLRKKINVSQLETEPAHKNEAESIPKEFFNPNTNNPQPVKIDNTTSKEIPLELHKRSKPNEKEEELTIVEPSFKLYKPNRSSSLRSSVVVAEDITSPEKETEDVKTAVTKVKAAVPVTMMNFGSNDKTDAAAVPQASLFSFTFKKPEKPFAEEPVADDKIVELPSNNIFNKATTSQSVEKTEPAATPVFSFANSATVDVEKPKETNIKPAFSFGQPSIIEKKSPPKVTTIDEDKQANDYVFEAPSASNIDPNSVDEAKVENFKSLFAF